MAVTVPIDIEEGNSEPSGSDCYDDCYDHTIARHNASCQVGGNFLLEMKCLDFHRAFVVRLFGQEMKISYLELLKSVADLETLMLLLMIFLWLVLLLLVLLLVVLVLLLLVVLLACPMANWQRRRFPALADERTGFI